MRNYSICDRLCINFDQFLRAMGDHSKTTGRPVPLPKTGAPELTEAEQKHAAALMRINHAGEICAQALYHGQMLVSRSSQMRAHLELAAKEEGDHLVWCKSRLDALNSHPSYLNPLWYTGSFCIGMMAGMIGDDWSLGFIAETERQVIAHLETHLEALTPQDQYSFAILKQMEIDEAAHRDEAIAAGGRELPGPIKKIMNLTSKIMVNTAYWV